MISWHSREERVSKVEKGKLVSNVVLKVNLSLLQGDPFKRKVSKERWEQNRLKWILGKTGAQNWNIGHSQEDFHLKQCKTMK